MRQESDIDYVNGQIVLLVEAMLCSITPNFRAVSIDCREESVALYFVLDEESHDSREDIDDIVFEYQALQEVIREIELIVVVDHRDLAALNIPGRFVYQRKE